MHGMKTVEVPDYDVVAVVAKPGDPATRIEILKAFWNDEQLRKRRWHEPYWD